ncbi:MAG: diacylglycerol kinase accessory domain-containing protein [Monoraphidium minutum]|nr:MAG: diacylglycerol kinase accessory domain-containing protein [Monoraphidium minutum]
MDERTMEGPVSDQFARAGPQHPSATKSMLLMNEPKTGKKDRAEAIPGSSGPESMADALTTEASVDGVGASVAPLEVTVSARDTEAYLEWRAATDLRGPYRLAPELLRGTRKDTSPDFDQGDAPLIAFINAKSGGRVGPRLAQVLSRALGTSQVFDLSENSPERVLRALWRNLDAQEAAGNPAAALVRSRLRILVCGGDGTVAWVFKTITDLGLQPPPPVAIMPLGTGNDLSRSFKWGPAFMYRWIKGHANVYASLKRIADADVGELDAWQLRVTVPGAGAEMPHTYALQRVDAAAAAGGASACAATLGSGRFFNYFSVGGDAQAAFGFHHLREARPGWAGSRLANQFWYSWYSCSSGWFCNAIPSVSAFSNVEVLRGGAWEALTVPPTIKALVVVNLQSYGGGRNIWGTKMRPDKARRRGFVEPSVDDGMIEVVGFTHGWQAMAVMITQARATHAKRLGQASGIRLTLRGGPPGGPPRPVYMQLDGEPWCQAVPAGSAEAPVVVEVSLAGRARVLTNVEGGRPALRTKVADVLPPGSGGPEHYLSDQQRSGGSG